MWGVGRNDERSAYCVALAAYSRAGSIVECGTEDRQTDRLQTLCIWGDTHNGEKLVFDRLVDRANAAIWS